MNRSSFAVLFSSLYFLVYLLVLPLDYLQLTWFLFFFSPLVLVYVVYSVIRYGSYSGKELVEEEEWGYEDADKETPGTWG